MRNIESYLLDERVKGPSVRSVRDQSIAGIRVRKIIQYAFKSVHFSFILSLSLRSHLFSTLQHKLRNLFQQRHAVAVRDVSQDGHLLLNACAELLVSGCQGELTGTVLAMFTNILFPNGSALAAFQILQLVRQETALHHLHQQFLQERIVVLGIALRTEPAQTVRGHAVIHKQIQVTAMLAVGTNHVR